MTFNPKTHNSEDFQEPEFVVELDTSFGTYKVEAYNVGKGFVLENEWCTPTLCRDISELPKGLESITSKLENNLDTMT